MQTSPFVTCKASLLPSGKSDSLLVWMLPCPSLYPFSKITGHEIFSRKGVAESDMENDEGPFTMLPQG
jgi:hypothetical protein